MSQQTGTFEQKFLASVDLKMFRKNAFRITGLPTNATNREIRRLSDQMKIHARFGGFLSEAKSVLPVDPPPTPEAIREATQILLDTENRFVHELLWLWEEDIPQYRSLAANQRLAISDYVTALDVIGCQGDSPASESEEMRQWTLRSQKWCLVLGDKAVDEVLSARARILNDERVPKYESDGYRKLLRRALAKLHFLLASHELGRARQMAGKHHLALAENFDADFVAADLESLRRSYREKVRARCCFYQDTISAEVRCAPVALASLEAETTPLLQALRVISPEFDIGYQDVSDLVAVTVRQAGICYANETKDYVTSQRWLEFSLQYAVSEELRQRLAEDLRITVSNQQHHELTSLLKEIGSLTSARQRCEYLRSRVLPLYRAAVTVLKGDEESIRSLSSLVVGELRSAAVDVLNQFKDWDAAVQALELASEINLAPELGSILAKNLDVARRNATEAALRRDLEPVNHAPALSTINGVGTMLYGKSDKKLDTYVTTLYFVFLFLPLFPLARYRVRCVAPGRYQFLGKARFRRIEKIHGGIFAAAVLGIFLVLMFSASFHSLDTPTPAAQDQAQTETPSTSETDQPQVDVQAPKQVATAPTPARSPHKSQHRNLSAEKLLLDNEKSRLTSLREQLQTLDGELSQEQDRLRVEKTALSNLQQAAEAGTEIDIDAAESRRSAYNEAVEAFNRKLAEYKRIQKEFNDGVADYNTKAHAYNLSLEEQ